jgi:hypothetical protein
MTDDNRRADIARDHDDSELIESMEDAPSHGGSKGGKLHTDIGSRAELEHEVGGSHGVTRVQDKHKEDLANLPRYNDRT